MGLLQLVERQQRLTKLWENIPDPALQRIEVDRIVRQEEGQLILRCHSSVALSYLRRQRALIEQYLEDFMRAEGLSTLTITLSDL